MRIVLTYQHSILKRRTPTLRTVAIRAFLRARHSIARRTIVLHPSSSAGCLTVGASMINASSSLVNNFNCAVQNLTVEQCRTHFTAYVSRVVAQADVYDKISRGQLFELYAQLALNHLVEVDEVNGLVTVSADMNLLWTDTRLVWNIPGTPFITLRTNQVFIPDLFLMNAVGNSQVEMGSSIIVYVYDCGLLSVSFPVALSFSVKFDDQTYFPFDTHDFILSFRSFNWRDGIGEHSITPNPPIHQT